tara:strand:+ start:118 stop:393 length:276 start_codon:yes stop_codon:yes gene_type:complete
MKEGKEMSITINGFTKEDTAYDKRITFEREGVEYSVLLHWDSYDGYDLQFLNGRNFIPYPDWASDWQSEGAESLEYYLDGLTEDVMEDANV